MKTKNVPVASGPELSLHHEYHRHKATTKPLHHLVSPPTVSTIDVAPATAHASALATFREYLLNHARVPLRDTRHGSYGPFTFTGRAPLDFLVTLIDKILANCLHNQTVEIDGLTFLPGQLKGATLSVGGGAQFGKTVLILNFQAFATFVEFIHFGYYTPDQELLAKIVDTKFRPDVLDQQPWMSQLVQLGKSENASGKAVNRKNSYQASQNGRKAFGHFCGMQKPPTTISLDAAALDEVDDIPARNLGYVDGRMTGSRLQLKIEIGTQRIAGAGQNARLKAGTHHVMMYTCGSVGQTFEPAGSRGLPTPCPSPSKGCGKEWNLEETFPRCIRVRSSEFRLQAAGTQGTNVEAQETSTSSQQPTNAKPSKSSPGGEDLGEGEFPLSAAANISPSCIKNPASSITPASPDPILTPEMNPDRNSHYYLACPDCGTELDRDSGRYVAKNPHRLADAHFSVRVSQLNISAISLQEIVSAWHTALADPSGAALTAFHCDRLALPNAGAAQPITQTILDQCRTLGLGETEETAQPYEMTLGPSGFGVPCSRSSGSGGRVSGRFAGLDTGPRCWLWVDELRSQSLTTCVWAELIASGNAPTRIPELMQALNISCLFIDAGGEPDLTKRLVLALNGLENFTPPNLPRTDIFRLHLNNIGNGLAWNGDTGRWTNLRAAAVLFISGEAKGIEQTIGFTQDGKIYPLIKCNRSESIQTAVNDFLTPDKGVLELLNPGAGQFGVPPLGGGDTGKKLRTLPRARLPRTYLGPGVTQSLLDSHLLNLRKERDPITGTEDWINGAENHLGLAKVYARLATTIATTQRPKIKVAYSPHPNSPWSNTRIGNMGLGSPRSRQTEIQRQDDQARGLHGPTWH